MKKIIGSIIIVLIVSCSNEKKAETKNAVNVKVVKTDKTTTFSNVKDGSYIDWKASHLGGVQPRFGKIYVKEATFLINDNTLTNATVSIDMSTLTVESFPAGAEEIGKLTGHLQSKDFFDIGKFPTSKFELTKLENANGDYNSIITGNLTILAITKSISFNANVAFTDKDVSIKSEDFSVNRTDWGLTYNVEGTAGVPVDYIVSNNIGFTINVTLTR